MSVDSMFLAPYPTELPPEAFRMAADLLRGVVPSNKARAVHVGTEVLRFCLGQIMPDDLPPEMGSKKCHAGDECPCTVEEAAKALENCCDPTKAKQGFTMIPWPSIAMLVLEALLQLLKKS